MSNETSTPGSAPVAVRLLAVLLLAGGVIGLGLSIWMAVLGLERPVFVVLAVVVAAVFAFTAWAGMKLWRGSPEGYKWAKVLFAAQVPVVSLGGVSYGFYTLLGFNLQLGSAVDAFRLNMGSAMNLMYSPAEQPAFVGINVVALAAFLYLLLRTRAARGRTAGMTAA